MNNIFDIDRFGKLFVREFGTYSPKLVGIGSVGFGIFALTVIYSYVFESAPFNFSFVTFGIVLIILAPLIFHKGIDRIGSIFDFTLPASSFEKFAAKWCLSVILMPVFVIVFLLLIAGLYKVMPGGLCFDAGNQIIHFLKNLSFEKVSFISAFQSFFLVGIFYFRKHVFWKVSLSLIVYFLLFALVFILFHRNIFAGSREISFATNFFGETVFSDANSSQSLFGLHSNIFVYISLNMVAPFGLWVVSFLKLREIEI